MLPIVQPLPSGPSIIDSNSRGEPLQKETQTELRVYSQRKVIRIESHNRT